MGLTVVSVKDLIQEIQKLKSAEKPDCDVELVEKLRTKFEARKDEELLSNQDIKFLESIYKKRWESIKKTPFNYLTNMSNSNEAWLNLASLLDEEEKLEKTAYHLLIPTLKNGTEIEVLACPITDFTLADCILTDDDLLVPLTICVNYHKSKGIFGMPLSLELDERGNGDSVKAFIRSSPLSPAELHQLKLKEPFYKYYRDKVIPQERDELRISRRTHRELLQLVNDSFRQKGLLAGKNYDEDEIKTAELAYHGFACYMSTVSEEEREALFSQRIELPGEVKRFRDIWELVTHQRYSDEGCIATNTKYYIKLLLDYWSDTLFSDEILASKAMRDFISQCIPQKKIFNDYSWLKEHDINFIVERIKNSIESKTFSCFYLTGSIIKDSQGIKKTVPDSVQKISRLIEENKTNPYYAYSMIVESVVIPKLESRNYFRYDDTDKWLLSLLIIPCILFEPEVLIAKLLGEQQRMASSETSSETIERISDKLAGLYVNKSNMDAENFCSRVYETIISGFIKLSSTSYKSHFLRNVLLITSENIVSERKEFFNLIKKAVVKRCAIQSAMKTSDRFWGPKPELDEAAYSKNRKILSSKSAEIKKIKSVDELINAISRWLNPTRCSSEGLDISYRSEIQAAI